MYRKDRPSRGGGVLNDTIPASVISLNLSNHTPKVITVRLNLPKTTILSCVYLPFSPSDSYVQDTISNLTILILQLAPLLVVISIYQISMAVGHTLINLLIIMCLP